MAYPTPDLPVSQEFRCVKVYIPTSVEDVFFSVLLGQMNELTKEYYWVQSGTMTPEQASFLWAQAIADTDADGEECYMLDCADVQDCIDTSTGTAETVIQAEKGLTPAIQQAKLGGKIPQILDCDPDTVWGAVNELVDYLNQASIDTFEIIESATNIAEIAIEWLGYGGFSDILQGALAYIAWLQEAIADEYSAEVTTALLDEYKCDLFCLHITNCNGLSIQDVAEYFQSRLTEFDFLDTLENLWDFLTTGTWNGTQVVDAMIMSMVGVMSVLDRPITQIVIGNLYTLDTVFSLGANNPDDDWAILCTDCAEVWCYEWDFTSTNGNPDIQIAVTYTGLAYGAYVGSVGYQTVNYGSGGGQGDLLHVRVQFPSLTNVTRITMTTAPYTASPTTLRAMYTLSGGTPNRFMESNDAGTTLQWSGNADFNEFWMQCVNSGATPDKITITKLRIEGTGSNPFGLSNCT